MLIDGGGTNGPSVVKKANKGKEDAGICVDVIPVRHSAHDSPYGDWVKFQANKKCRRGRNGVWLVWDDVCLGRLGAGMVKQSGNRVFTYAF